MPAQGVPPPGRRTPEVRRQTGVIGSDGVCVASTWVSRASGGEGLTRAFGTVGDGLNLTGTLRHSPEIGCGKGRRAPEQPTIYPTTPRYPSHSARPKNTTT